MYEYFPYADGTRCPYHHLHYNACQEEGRDESSDAKHLVHQEVGTVSPQ